MTENISHTGVLFRTQDLVVPDAGVDVRLEIELRKPMEIVCEGKVVRTGPRTPNTFETAATIARYKMALQGPWLKTRKST